MIKETEETKEKEVYQGEGSVSRRRKWIKEKEVYQGEGSVSRRRKCIKEKEVYQGEGWDIKRMPKGTEGIFCWLGVAV